jgi:hypothetical protein
MTQYRLPAGTDIGKMAFFDVDALPVSRLPNEANLDALAKKEQLVLMPTGEDGGYLLHLYVDEDVPAHINRYCVADDVLEGHFTTTQGRVAFGGAESLFQTFKPNRLIRSDVTIAPGNYIYTARHTNIPDKDIAKAVEAACPDAELRRAATPRNMLLLLVGVASLGVAITLAVRGLAVFAWLVVAFGFFVAKFVGRTATHRDMLSRREAAELDFPSIVIQMRSRQELSA